MLFEAEHSYMAYNDILDKKTDKIKSFFDRMWFPTSFLKYIKYSSYLMPLCHGMAAATPVYFSIRDVFGVTEFFRKGSSVTYMLKSTVAILIPLLTLIDTTLGHYRFEMREANEKITNRLEAAPLTKVVVEK